MDATVMVSGLIVAVVLIGASPAAADRWDVADQSGDAPRTIDVSRLAVRNGDVEIVARVRFYDLTRRRLGGVSVFLDTGRRFGEAYLVGLRWRERHGRFTRSLYRLPDLGDGVSARRHCDGIRVQWEVGQDIRRKYVVIALPQRCLGVDAGAVRVSATAFERKFQGGADAVPEEGTRKPLIRRG